MSNENKTITIYCHRVNDDGMVKSMRRILKNCSWEDNSISTALQTGNVLTEPASIRVFCSKSGLKYVMPHEWYILPEDELEKYWTVDLTRSALPLIVPFGSTWETDYDDESEIIRMENEYKRNTPGVLRIARFKDNRLFPGSHIRLQA